MIDKKATAEFKAYEWFLKIYLLIYYKMIYQRIPTVTCDFNLLEATRYIHVFVQVQFSV